MTMNPNDPKLRSFIQVAPHSDFPIQNLPYGVFSTVGAGKRVGVAIGDFVLDLAEVATAGLLPETPAGVFEAEALNPFMALGPDVCGTMRACGRARWSPWGRRACICPSRSPPSAISIRRSSTLPMRA